MPLVEAEPDTWVSILILPTDQTGDAQETWRFMVRTNGIELEKNKQWHIKCEKLYLVRIYYGWKLTKTGEAVTGIRVPPPQGLKEGMYINGLMGTTVSVGFKPDPTAGSGCQLAEGDTICLIPKSLAGCLILEPKTVVHMSQLGLNDVVARGTIPKQISS